MSHPKPLRSGVPSLIFPALLLFLPAAQAQSTWNTDDGTWQTDTNWYPSGPPASTEGVNILRPSDQDLPFTIDFDGDASVARLFLGETSNGQNTTTPVQATLDLDGNTLGITGVESVGLAFGSTNLSGDLSLTIKGGTVEALNLRISGTKDTVSTSYLYIRGSGAVLNTRVIAGGGNSFMGSNSPAEVHIIEGGSYITGSTGERTTVGGAGTADGNGKLFIQGAGSSCDGEYVTDVAWGGTGHLEVTAGGSFTETTFNMAGADNAAGTALISGPGSSFTAAQVNLGARAHFPGVDGGSGTNRVATLTIADGATATTSLLNLRGIQSTLALDGSTMEVTGNNNATLSDSAAFFDAGATLRKTLDTQPATPAALTVADRLHITDAVLAIQLSETFSAAVNDVFIVADYGALTGTFAGLSQNATLSVSDYAFQIDYGSGINDAIRLTVTGIP